MTEKMSHTWANHAQRSLITALCAAFMGGMLGAMGDTLIASLMAFCTVVAAVIYACCAHEAQLWVEKERVAQRAAPPSKGSEPRISSSK
jgi:hypothetical protein